MKKTIVRDSFHIIKGRCLEKRAFIQVLIGPRQVGKTTMVQQVLDSLKLPSIFISADGVSESTEIWIDQQWERARIQMKSGAGDMILAIDEIQKLKNWSESVKKNWDKDSREGLNLKVILLGSSSLLLQMGMSESLAGRFERTYMPHWSLAEMQAAFHISAEEYVWFGGYPGAAELFSDEARWREYIRESMIETIMAKDILMMSRIDKPVLLRRLFELGAVYSAQLLSYTKILGRFDERGNTTILSSYAEMMSKAGILATLEKFSGNEIRKRGSIPKWQVHNNALMSACSSKKFDETKSSENWGRWIESAIGAHLLNRTLTSDMKLRYWREGNKEVDFVLEKDGQLIGLEIKGGRSKPTSGMFAFQKKFSPHKVLLAGTEGIPWQDILFMDPLDLF